MQVPIMIDIEGNRSLSWAVTTAAHMAAMIIDEHGVPAVDECVELYSVDDEDGRVAFQLVRTE